MPLRLLRGLLRLAAACAVAAALVVAGANAVVVLTARDNIGDAEAAAALQADAIVVPGASVTADGEPSDILKARLDAAIELYFAGVADVIVMSGYDDGAYYNEAETMRQYALDQGVPSDAIVSDAEGDSTYDTMARAAGELGLGRVVVVTQGYHLHRCVYDAVAQGLEVVGVATDDGDGYDDQLWFELREVAARTKDCLLSLAEAF